MALQWLNSLPWTIIIIACLTLGLAPYNPPHVIEKLRMLGEGRLVRPLDIFDLVIHAAPWVLLALKAVSSLKRGG